MRAVPREPKRLPYFVMDFIEGETLGAYLTRMHTGVDIAVPRGTPIRAMRAGTVRFAGWNGASGLCIVVAHEGSVETSYKHCSKLRATRGERVKRHQILGEAGSTGVSTGSHLHFTVSKARTAATWTPSA